jgi:hypothetical protein
MKQLLYRGFFFLFAGGMLNAPISATSFDEEEAVHFQAPIRGTEESQDWLYHPDSGKFISPKGQVIEPWNQPKEIRDLRQQGYGLGTLQSLLASSVLRINSMSNGELTLYLSGRLRGGGGGQSTSRGNGGNGGSYPSCRNAGPSDRFCRIAPTYTNTDYQRDRQMSRETGITTVTIKGDRIVRNPHYGSSRDRGRSRDRTETTGSGGTITYIDGIEVPNDFLAFAEKYPEAAYRKYQHLKHDHLWRATKVFTVANKSIRSSSPPRASQKKGSVSDKVIKVWQQRVGHKVHAHRPYVIGVNVQGDVGVQDPRTGIVYTLFEGSRKHTDAYLPGHYPKQTQDYPAQDIQMGQWILGKYGDYKLTLNKALIREGEDLSCAPMRRVLLEDRTTKAMLATFGVVLNTMGPDKVYTLGKTLSKTNPNSGPALMDAAQWLYMFRKPEKYFTISLEKPIAVFKGEPLSHENVPSSVVKRWRKSPHFTKNIKGNLAIQDKRNSLTYTILVSDRRYSDDFLPVGYDYSDRDIQLGGWLIERYVDHKMGLHDVLIGNMEDRIHEIFSEPKHRTNKAILATFGRTLNTLDPSGVRKLSVQLVERDPTMSGCLDEVHRWLGMFKNPSRYVSLSMRSPLSRYRGVDIVHETIPSNVRTIWRKQNFTDQSLDGYLGFYEDRNGLLYPVYQDDYRRRGVMLPKGYELRDEHVNVGYELLENLGDCGTQILEELIGIPKQVHANPGVVMGRGCQALAATTGLALDTMLNNGELTKSVERAIKGKVRGIYIHIQLINEVVQELVRNGLGTKKEGKKLEKVISNAMNQNPQDFEPDSDDEKEKEEGNDNSKTKIDKLNKDIRDFLGKDYKMKTNKYGDKVFLSKDGLRKVRFDIKNPHPHKNPHSHVEVFKNGKWHKYKGEIYMKDVGKF